MLTIRLSSRLFALLFTTLLAIPLQAGFVSYGFLGQINSVDAPLDAVFSLGDELAIFHVMDAAIADTNPDPTTGIYPDSIVSTYSRVGLGLHSGAGAGGNVVVQAPGLEGDSIQYSGLLSGPDAAGCSLTQSTIALKNLAGGVHDDDAFPSSPPDLASYPFFPVILLSFDCGGSTAVIQGPIMEVRPFQDCRNNSANAVTDCSIGTGISGWDDMSSGSPPVWAPEDGSVNSGSLELSNDGIVQQCTAIGENVPVRLSADVRVDSGTIDNYCAAFAVFYQGANCTGALLEFDFVSCQTSMTGCPTSWSSLLPASGPGTSVLLISPPTTLSAGAQLLCNGAAPFTTRFDNVILEIGIFADGFESGDLLFWSATFP